LDEATGLYYFNARWYDPQMGRFTTEDPIRDGMNWFAYVNKNPLGFVDPSGLRGNSFQIQQLLSESGKSRMASMAMADSPLLPFGDLIALGYGAYELGKGLRSNYDSWREYRETNRLLSLADEIQSNSSLSPSLLAGFSYNNGNVYNSAGLSQLGMRHGIV